LLLRKRSGHPFSQSIDLVQPILLPTAHPRHSYHRDPCDNVIIYATSLSPGDAVPSLSVTKSMSFEKGLKAMTLGVFFSFWHHVVYTRLTILCTIAIGRQGNATGVFFCLHPDFILVTPLSKKGYNGGGT
jgi:hypothetical protein